MGEIILLAALNCYSIVDADQRNYCIARERQDSGQCYSIADQNIRTQCRAELQQEPSVCDGMSNSTHDERQVCRSRAGK